LRRVVGLLRSQNERGKIGRRGRRVVSLDVFLNLECSQICAGQDRLLVELLNVSDCGQDGADRFRGEVSHFQPQLSKLRFFACFWKWLNLKRRHLADLACTDALTLRLDGNHLLLINQKVLQDFVKRQVFHFLVGFMLFLSRRISNLRPPPSFVLACLLRQPLLHEQ